jgi:isoquinoline 1-oxidoreductase beta subunit
VWVGEARYGPVHAMTPTRRGFLKAGALGGAALVLRIPLFAESGTPAAARFAPNQWLRVGADGRATLVIARSEMGQGVRTALAMVLAEELDADWQTITLEQASPGPDYPRMSTGGSGSVEGSWKALRQAGAAAREMLVEAAARRWGVAASACRTEAGQVIDAASGRKLGYGELVAAASALPVPKEPRLKDPKDFRLVGTRVRRIDGPAIVTGRAIYGIDTRVPGMLFAAVAVCPVRGGRVVRFDAASAKRVPGVREVVEFDGGVAVLAENTYAAFEGRDALAAAFDDGAAGGIDTAELWRRIDAAAEKPGRATRTVGDAGTALATAATRLSASYRAPFQAHATMEPGNCTARVADGACEIWAPTQNPQRVQREAARLLGIAPEKVTVHVTLLGGGFGRRLDADYAVEAVAVARAAKRPVQVVWSRRDDFLRDRVHPGARVDVAAGLDASGRVVAWKHHATAFHLTMFGAFNPKSDPEGNPWGGYDIPYDIANLAVSWSEIESPIHTGAWRAVHYPANIFARECFLDELAARSGQDPLALRLALLGPASSHAAGSRGVDRAGLARVLSLAAEKAGWASPPAARPGRRSGRGLACNVYDGSTLVAQVVDASVGGKGDVVVHRVVTAVDCGQAVNPSGAEGQVESGVIWALSYALKGEVTIAKGRVVETSFDAYPVLRMDETPKLETVVLSGHGAATGLGEIPVPCVAPALANALFAATGKRLRRLPIRAADLA